MNIRQWAMICVSIYCVTICGGHQRAGENRGLMSAPCSLLGLAIFCRFLRCAAKVHTAVALLTVEMLASVLRTRKKFAPVRLRKCFFQICHKAKFSMHPPDASKRYTNGNKHSPSFPITHTFLRTSIYILHIRSHILCSSKKLVDCIDLTLHITRHPYHLPSPTLIGRGTILRLYAPGHWEILLM